jgi:hypothetical protein
MDLKAILSILKCPADGEFQKACEDIAGISLRSEFEYVNTTKEIDYAAFQAYTRLKLKEQTDNKTGKRKFTIARQDNLSPSQISLFRLWTGN